MWFGLQALVLGGVAIAMGWWVGGERGGRVALLAPLLWLTPVTFFSLQMGNFQITAVPIALLGMVLAWSRRDAAGGALLAFTAAGKVFPSMLVLHAGAALRWRAMVWVAAMALAFAVAAAGVFGLTPFVEFVRDELPRLVSGASFPQTEIPGAMPLNMSIYGMTAKLRLLGAGWLDQPVGKHVAQAYAALLAGFVFWAGFRVRATADRRQPNERLQLTILWLAILNLASLGGPFVPAMYGAVGTLWLLTLLAAAADAPSRFWTWVALFLVLSVAVVMIPTPRPTEMPASSTLMASLVIQIGVFAVNVWAAASWVATTRRTGPPTAAPMPAS